MLRRLLTATLALLAIVAVYAFATAPGALVHVPVAPDIDAPLERWLAKREDDIHRTTPIIPGAEKRVRWFADQADSRTPLSIVYLHGFSATRQEIAPVGDMLADALGANLFETRLAGHGLVDAPLTGIAAERWLDDAVEALTIGAEIGERIIVVGVSTGATLALAVSGHEAFDKVAGIVLMSPNFAPHDPSAELLTMPGGPQLAQLLVGDTHRWEAANALQERYWSTSYPTAAIVEMMRLVDLTNDQLPLRIPQPVLALYSPNDRVVDPVRIRESLKLISAPRSQQIEIEEAGDRSNHVLAGDILSPGNNALVTGHIVRFVEAALL